MLYVFFFFSSRRRHTRFSRDWEFRRVLFRSGREGLARVHELVGRLRVRRVREDLERRDVALLDAERADAHRDDDDVEIGRASWRERGTISAVAGACIKKK